MGDSDDEYDRKRRDKFRGERDSYRSDRRDDRSKGREDPYDRPRSNRGPPSDYRDSYGRSQRERNYSPDRGPPMKRTRHDWDDRPPRYGGGHEPYGMYGGGYGHHDPYYSPMGFHGPPPGLPRDSAPAAGDTPTQPAMLTLKQFLGTQDDSISDQDAITKYNEYKVDFKRQQLNEFFVAHKDEEWFKIKYHPEESLKRREEQLEYLKNRINVFSELLDSGDIQKTNVDMPNSEQIIRLLDTVVIKLEGGTEEDLKVLDHKPEPPKPIEVTPKKDVEKAESVEKTEESEKKDEDVEMKEPEAPAKEEKRREKRKRSRSSGSSGSSSSSSSSSSDTSEDEAPKSPPKEEEPKEEVEKEKEEEPKEEVEEGEKTENGEEKDEEGEEKPEGEEKEEGEGEEKAEKSEGEGETEEAEKPETIDVDQPKEVIRELHRTSSIFLRNLAPTITKAEVEAMCKRYSGFLRVAIADPLVERRWFRRGWVTFQREVNIKEICWNLNNIRLRDCELGAIVNRDLSRRVRPVNGITVHRSIIRSDIKLAAKIAHNLDVKANLWVEGEDAEGGTEKNGSSKFGFNTKNPVLSNITDYLIEEASAEEEELLGLSKEDGKEGTEGEPIERDPDLILVLDKIILYLRIVHSVDFYNHCEYPYEDEMPNRCGIIHARGPVPQNNVTQTEIQEWIRNFEKKISSSLLAKSDEELKEEELKKLGCKDQDEEVEKFIKANTQELGKDKWLCPLSGKKFKGPDFIRKHIFNKHSEKVEEVRKEVSYFNNYLKDSKRPQLPEHPANTRKTDNPAPAQPQYRPPPYGGMPYGGMPYGGFPMIGRSRGGFRGRGPPPAVDYRPVIHYRDLDAPREPEEF